MRLSCGSAPPKPQQARAELALVLQGSQFHNCVVGCNTFVGTGCSLTDCLLMGNDNYTNAASIERALTRDKLIIGIGAHLVLSSVH